MRILVFLALALPCLAQGIASRNVKPSPRGKPSGLPFHARFTDVAAQAGLTVSSIYGGVDRIDYLLETSAGGVAFVDYDNDGHLDIFLVDGTRLTTPEPAGATNRMYHNNGDGTFTDVTARSGLLRTGWGCGVALGDYDNDGFIDLFVTYWGESVLYRNRGDGTFVDVTRKLGLRRPASTPWWDAGAVFFDYDRDGRLDLFISGYVDFDPARTPKPGENSNCTWKGLAVACGPRGLKPGRPWLFHQKPDGAFEDVSQKSGIAGVRSSFGMTAVSADFDDDGWPDIYVACDSTPSLFFRNQHDGTFLEEGIERGIALNDDGKEQAGMGIGLGDVNLDGRLDILKTHFADDTHMLYLNVGEGNFSDATLVSGLGVETRYVGWGAGIQDLDNDGLPDVFIVTGNVYPETQKQLPSYPYLSPRLLFRNLGSGRFEQLMGEAGPGITARHSSRGAAFGDFDNDGDIDIVVFNRNEAPSLLRNDLSNGNHWIEVKLVGRASNRSALGARVTARYGGKTQVRELCGSGSFYSANDLRLHFGLGKSSEAALTIRWPKGKVQQVELKAVDRVISIEEPD